MNSRVFVLLILFCFSFPRSSEAFLKEVSIFYCNATHPVEFFYPFDMVTLARNSTSFSNKMVAWTGEI